MRVHGGQPGRAIPRGTITGLNTAQRKHKGPGHITPIRPQRYMAHHIIGRYNFARGGNFHPLAQARPFQGIIHIDQRIAQRTAQMIGKFYRRCPCATFRPSTVIKSTATSISTIALTIAANSQGWPIHNLMPTGLPPESWRRRAANSTKPRGVEKFRMMRGEIQS